MGGGGSHPQATMMPDPWARSCRPSEGQTMVKAPPETVTRVDSSRRPFAPAGGFRGARIRPATRAPSTRVRNPNLTREELQLRKLAEQEQRLSRKKEEAWELYQRQPTLMRRTRENFETKFREKVLGGIYSSSKDEQEKELQSWMNELEKTAQEEERRLEAIEKKKEDVQSRGREAWDKIFRSFPNLSPKPASSTRYNQLTKCIYLLAVPTRVLLPCLYSGV